MVGSLEHRAGRNAGESCRADSNRRRWLGHYIERNNSIGGQIACN